MKLMISFENSVAQHTFLVDCFDRVMEERKWDDPGD